MEAQHVKRQDGYLPLALYGALGDECSAALCVKDEVVMMTGVQRRMRAQPSVGVSTTRATRRAEAEATTMPEVKPDYVTVVRRDATLSVAEETLQAALDQETSTSTREIFHRSFLRDMNVAQSPVDQTLDRDGLTNTQRDLKDQLRDKISSRTPLDKVIDAASALKYRSLVDAMAKQNTKRTFIHAKATADKVGSALFAMTLAGKLAVKYHGSGAKYDNALFLTAVAIVPKFLIRCSVVPMLRIAANFHAESASTLRERAKNLHAAQVALTRGRRNRVVHRRTDQPAPPAPPRPTAPLGQTAA